MARIALIAGTYQPKSCGVAHYTAHLRDALAKQDVESVVLTTHQAVQDTNETDVLGVVYDWNFTSLFPLVWAIHSLKVDLLHIQHAAGTYRFDRSIFLLPLLLRLTGWRSPIVTTVHEYGWWEWQPKWLPASFVEWLKVFGQQRNWWDREDGFLLTQSSAVVTTNSDAKRIIHTRLPQLSDRVQQIPIGANVEVAPIDRDKARQQVRHDCNWPETALIISFFGFLHPVKGLETLLPAFKHVLETHPQVRLLLIGGVESLALPGEQAARYWNQLLETIADLNLTGMVHMTGYLDAENASKYLSGSDIGVLPFNHGLTLKSGSLLAMMAHSLPIVATRSNGSNLELEAEQIVRLVSPRNVNQLTVELVELIADSEARNQLGKAGQQFSRAFSWSSITDAHREIYQTVLEGTTITASGSIA